MPNQIIVKMKDIDKEYTLGETKIHALKILILKSFQNLTKNNSKTMLNYSAKNA
ncbi:MAG: hypothetical protein MUC94_16435 [bacterium]|jgi:hypothetical protein|nr:hypothetical protein [bacterium]